jgi:glycosyltransferase EpsF
MKNEINVLMITGSFTLVNGVVNYAMNYYNKLNHNNVHMDFVIYDSNEICNKYAKILEKNGDHLYVLPPIKNYKDHINCCKELLKNNNYDIVHDNSLINTIPLMMEAKKLNIPVRILHAHATKLGETYFKEIRNGILLPILKNTVNCNFACSEAAGHAMFKNESYELIPNIINGNKYFYKNEIRHKIRKEMNVENRKIVITVGRLALQKNPYFAVDVMNKVIEKDSNVVYWWIGNGEEYDSLKKYIQKSNCSDSIKLLGKKDNINEFLSAADCFFLPSQFEGLPVSGVEAQTAGLPCIMSDVITQEIVYTDGLINFVSLDSPIEHWADTIISCLNESYDRSSIISEFKKSKFNDETAGKTLTDMYIKAINNNIIVNK